MKFSVSILRAAGGVSLGLLAFPMMRAQPAVDPALGQYHRVVQPILEKHCFDCHGNGVNKANLALDELTTREQILQNPQLWFKVLRNTRSHIMPPPDNPPPTPAEQAALEQWIKTAGFGLEADQFDPGRVTVRRLNRTEYRNTLRDLIGVEIETDALLPPDDVGYGFDNIGDVLSISPMRLEKFIEAAIAAVEKGVPQDTVALESEDVTAAQFRSADGKVTADRMSFYEVNKTSYKFNARVAGEYRVHFAIKIDGSGRPDPQKVKVSFRSDDEEFLQKEYHYSDADYFDHYKVLRWEAGERELSFVTEPVFPELKPPTARMDFRLMYARIEGPLDRKDWRHPPGYKRFYDREQPPTDPAARRAYAREVLARFVPKAFRRPVPPETIDRLVDLAEQCYSPPGVPFERGVAQAIVAVLSSPRFLFHLETAEPAKPGERYPRIDEYTLASRLSYTLWCSMPDDELLQLAGRGELRKNFHAQVRRMLADPKADAFTARFPGQWLQSQGVIDVQINSAEVMAAEKPKPEPAPVVSEVAAATPAAPALRPAAAPQSAPAPVAPPAAAPAPLDVGAVVAAIDPPADPAAPGAGRGGRGRGVGRGAGRGGAPGVPPPLNVGRGRRPAADGTELTSEIRKAMKQEPEAFFSHIVREDRSVLEFLKSDYTFVNEALAPVYGIPNIKGAEMQKVALPADSMRGGVLTMGSTLTVTSNPTRTSPVKRGRWILENILGTPPAPPPPDVPALEEAQEKVPDRKLSQREMLAAHAAQPLCASCHSRMDPLGLALENFNAFGRGRTQEHGLPVDTAGQLATGEKFADVRDVKQALIDNHRHEFYRTITEKLLTYALGRGVEYYDVPTVDRIVERLDRDNGRFSTLLFGVLESTPFQHRRPAPHAPTLANN